MSIRDEFNAKILHCEVNGWEHASLVLKELRTVLDKQGLLDQDQSLVNECAALRNQIIQHLSSIGIYKRELRQHMEFGNLFQPGGRFHKEANLPLGSSAVKEGGKWMVEQYDKLKQGAVLLDYNQWSFITRIEVMDPDGWDRSNPE